MDVRLTASDPRAYIPDPTDWDDTKFPLLNPLDSALHCDICKDFYSSPVITNCSHTFCSVCIRRALHAEQICPICRTAEQEFRLRKNPVVQELVNAFLLARPELLEVARKVAPVANPSRASSPLSTHDEQEEQMNERPPAKRPRSTPRTTRSTGSTPRYEEHGDEIVEVPSSNDGLVSCPSCQGRVKIDMMNSHLDSCLSDEYKPPSKSPLPVRSYATRSSKTTPSVPAVPLQPLPKINYSFMKDNALRSKLTELGIPAGGPRKLLQERYSEWMTIWNANVDASQPRRKAALLADLATWERAHVRPSNQPSKAQWSDDQWKNKHEAQFSALVAEARERAVAARKKKEEAAQEAAQKRANEGDFPMEVGSRHSPERLQDSDRMIEAPSATLPVDTAPRLSVDRLGGSSTPITIVESNLGFGPHMGEHSWGQDLSRVDAGLQDFLGHNGKRKYNDIDSALLAGVIQNRTHK